MSKELRRKIIYSLIFALILYIVMALWSDWQDLTAAVADFPWRLMPIIIGLTLVSYTGRLLRWHWYLQVIGADISRKDSARIFGVGMMMVMTPGKAGEFLKSYMVKNVSGTPMSKTAPIILAERILDAMAMIILAAVGLFAFPSTSARMVGVIVFAVFATFIIVIQVRPLALWFLGLAERMPGINRFAEHLHVLYESSYIIFRPRNISISILVGLFCWGVLGLAYYVALTGFGVEQSWQSLAIAIFIFNISTVIGAVIALPGGLGGVEGSMVAWSVRLFGLSTATATAAALLTRFSTLWMGVAIGVVSFMLWPELLAGSEDARKEFDADRAEIEEIGEAEIEEISDPEIDSIPG